MADSFGDIFIVCKTESCFLAFLLLSANIYAEGQLNSADFFPVIMNKKLSQRNCRRTQTDTHRQTQNHSQHRAKHRSQSKNLLGSTGLRGPHIPKCTTEILFTKRSFNI